MTTIRIPNNWNPRPYQKSTWMYLQKGGTLAYVIAHRRWGKDDVALHWTARSTQVRPATYWHMLPQASQARKAVWDAINPHTGIRRINEAFPLEIRATTREQEMLIVFKSGATWQVIGSDNYDSLVGAPPVGIVFSEWALAKPQAWAYIRRMLAENGGWAFFITTPRGHNHAARMFESLQQDPKAFVLKSTALDTTVFSEEQLAHELQAYIAEYGETVGQALYEQEYLCSFDAAIQGAIFASELAKAKIAGRIKTIRHDTTKLVYTSWDIGIGDPTAIWFYEKVDGEIRFFDFYESKGEAITHYMEVLRAKGYKYHTAWMPHDAANRQFGAEHGLSIANIMRKNQFNVRIVPKMSLENGINSARLLIEKCYFDTDKCKAGLDALMNYRWDYNKRLEELKHTPLHDWSSHASDSFRYAAVSMKEDRPAMEQPKMSGGMRF